jgi:hypothetical protein
MFCWKIFILPVFIQKYHFPLAAVEFNWKQLSLETNLFRSDYHSIESKKLKQLKMNRNEKKGSKRPTFSSNLSLCLFHIDTHHTEPWRQWDRWWRSTSSLQCSTTKQCMTPAFSSNLSFFLFHIDNNHTEPLIQSDWSTRITTPCHCSTTKQCKIFTFSSNLSFFLFYIDTH